MSLVVEKFINCDGNSVNCVENFGVDLRNSKNNQTLWSLRKGSADNGWIVFKNKDYCPECKEQLDKIKE